MLSKNHDTFWQVLMSFEAFRHNLMQSDTFWCLLTQIYLFLVQYFNVFYFFKQARYTMFWGWHALFFSISWCVLMRFDRFQRFLTRYDMFWHIKIIFVFFSRQDIQCFGDHTCYSLAFGVPAVLMLIATVILVIGKNLWIKGLLKVRKSRKLMFKKSMNFSPHFCPSL